MNTPPASQVPVELQAGLYLLKEFLEEERRRREHGITLERILSMLQGVIERHDRTQASVETLIREVMQQGMRLNRYKERLMLLEKRVYSEEERKQASFVDTGVHRLQDVQHATEMVELKIRLAENEKKLESRNKKDDEEQAWWKKQRYIWAAALAFIVITTLATGCGTYVMWKITQASTPQIQPEKKP